jgi:uncharacterized protein with von Willebrand factor type A (vWA) domain
MKRKPVTRQQLLELAVTDVDAFMAHRYLRHREAVPTLLDLEDKGSKTLPGVEGALNDLNHALWSPEPGVKDEVAPDRRYWRELLGQTMQTAAYQELHAQTQLRDLQAVLGTIAMGESILVRVPEKDREQLEEVAKAQQNANQQQQQAQKAQAQAQAAQQLADVAAQAGQGQGEGEPSDQPSDGEPQPGQGQPGSGQPQSSSGQPQGQQSGDMGKMTSEEAKAIANELAEQAAQAKAEAQAAQQRADEAKANAEQLAEALMGAPDSQQAADKQRELARIGLAAVKQAQEQVKDISDTVQAWGLEPGELTRDSFAEVQAILERIKRNPNLKQFSRLLGRLRQIAARKAKSKDKGEGIRVTTTETGRDLKRAVPSELVALSHSALAVKAKMRWARGELRLRGQKTKRKLGHGPVVVLEDASGSMDGVKQQWTKALVLALAYFARLQRRSFGWALFDTYVRVSHAYPQGALSAKDMIEIAESRAGGGTDFERPLRKAVEMIQKEGLRKADILLVTDGMCAISDAFLKELKAVKKALEVQIFTVLVNVGDTTDATVKEFSDRIIPISKLTADEAESKVIALL